jgi:hypothetical protein
MPGEFIRPRALAVDGKGDLIAVDFRATIQVFSSEGKLKHHWRTPDHAIGRPSGVGVDHHNNIYIADSHYHQVLVYSPTGQLIQTMGGDTGTAPHVGRFGYIADIALDSKGNIYIAEAQQHERITKMASNGTILAEWGRRGELPGEFQRIRAIFIDAHDRLFVADACNHRIQVFDDQGRHLQTIGAGLLDYPFDVVTTSDGTILVAEWGANQVRRFSADGRPMDVWGAAGKAPGQLNKPWGLAIDSRNRLFVADTENHRIQVVGY